MIQTIWVGNTAGESENERGKYKLWFRGRAGVNELMLRGDYLDLYVAPSGTVSFRRVP